MSAEAALKGLEQVAIYLEKVTATFAARAEYEAELMGDEYEELYLRKHEVEALIRNLGEAADSIRVFSTVILMEGQK